MDQDLKQKVNDLEQKLNDFLDQYNRNSAPSSQIFTKKVTIAGGLSLNGSSLGSAGDLMSVYGEAPVAQAAAIANPTSPGATYSQAEAASMVNAFNNLRNAIQAFGIIA
jgi:hypothetical protein